HAQNLAEANLIDAFDSARGAADPATAVSAAQRLKRYYHGQVKRLRERSHFVTRLSSGILVSIVTLVLTGMMAYFAAIRVWLVRPLQRIGRATGVISTGNLEHRIPVVGADEFGALASSINTMAASLADNQRRLL